MFRRRYKLTTLDKGFIRYLMKYSLYHKYKVEISRLEDDKTKYKMALRTKKKANVFNHFFLDHTETILDIHKGHFYKPIAINKYNVGYKFGEFIFTKKPFYFPPKNKSSKNKLIKR